MKKKHYDNDPPEHLTQDHFDLQIQRLEEAYLTPTRNDVDSIEKSMRTVKICIEIICGAAVGAFLLYIATTIIHLLQQT